MLKYKFGHALKIKQSDSWTVVVMS